MNNPNFIKREDGYFEIIKPITEEDMDFEITREHEYFIQFRFMYKYNEEYLDMIRSKMNPYQFSSDREYEDALKYLPSSRNLGVGCDSAWHRKKETVEGRKEIRLEQANESLRQFVKQTNDKMDTPPKERNAKTYDLSGRGSSGARGYRGW